MSQKSTDPIDSFTGQYRWLSNFWVSPMTVDIDGIQGTFQSVEHVYQALKSCDQGPRLLCLNADSPARAKKLGRLIRLREDWNKVRVPFMTELVRAKFTQNKDLAARLLATGERMLVEGNYWGDTFWGVCRGRGFNNLGAILMQIREELQADA